LQENTEEEGNEEGEKRKGKKGRREG